MSAISRPRPITIRCSAVSAISLIRCDGDEDRPALGGQRLEQVADPQDALRVQPVDRLVQHAACRGSPSSADGDAQPLAHAEGEPAGPLARHLVQADQVDHLVDPSAAGCRWWRPAPAGGCGADRPVCTARASSSAPTSRSGAACSAYGRPLTVTVPRGRRVQAEDHAHRGGLAGAVRAEETGDHARPDREGQVVHGHLVAVALGQLGDFDHAPQRWPDPGGPGASAWRGTLRGVRRSW